MFRRSSTFVIVTLAVVAVVWGALWLFPRIALARFHPRPVVPSTIDLIAVHKGAGYRITISNGIAHLVEVEGSGDSFDAPQDDREELHNAARLPIRETLQALQGDADALGKLVMSINKMRTDDLPTVQVVWTAEDLKKAIEGDAALRTKLERDLNTRLDGTPLDSVSIDAILNGIVIDSPVAVKIPFEGKEREVVCRVREPYKSLFAGAVDNQVNQRFNVKTETLVGLYRDEANKVLQGGRKEDVAGSLRARIDRQRLQERAAAPERILNNIEVVVTDKQMLGASFVPYEGPNRSILCDVTIKLTDEGRMRLWKHSLGKPGFQLLLTVDGVAIAAPRIGTELSGPEVVLTKVPSKEQVEDAVAFINRTAKGS